MSDIIVGRNPVIETIKSGRSINKLLIQKGRKEGSINKIIARAKDRNINIEYVDIKKLNSITKENHQGVIAYVPPYDYKNLDDILESVENPFIIVCDEITDTHNLGSILRTADAVGVDAVIIPERRSVSLNETVAKTSVGAVEYVPVCREKNIARTIEKLKKYNIWVFGADMNGEQAYYDADLTGSIALVVGSEGKGISRLVKERCDFLVNIPMVGKISSLNASVAASIIMYEVFKKRNGA